MANQADTDAELEFIHPFADGNGRLGRLWQTLILSQRAVEKHLAALQQKGRLLRHGSPRAGYWQVL
jgi:fido (protein-threonine AMPylation protein)